MMVMVGVCFLLGTATSQASPDAGVQPSSASSTKATSSPTKRRESKRKAKNDDAAIRRRMIKESIADYEGPCPCPYNLARNGSQCGGRSAYSRPGGAAPLCYPRNITDEMVQEYRATHSTE